MKKYKQKEQGNKIYLWEKTDVDIPQPGSRECTSSSNQQCQTGRNNCDFIDMNRNWECMRKCLFISIKTSSVMITIWLQGSLIPSEVREIV